MKENLGDDRQALLAKLQPLAMDLAAADFPHPSSIPVMIDKWEVGNREVPCLLGDAFGHPTIFDGGASISSELFYMLKAGSLKHFRDGIASATVTIRKYSENLPGQLPERSLYFRSLEQMMQLGTHCRALKELKALPQ